MQFQRECGEIHDTPLLQVRQVSDALKRPDIKKLTPWSTTLLDKSTAPHLPKETFSILWTPEVHYSV
jgi:hypothetical protein